MDRDSIIIDDEIVRKQIAREILQELYLNFTVENLCGVKNRFVNDKSANLIKRFSKAYGIELED